MSNRNDGTLALALGVTGSGKSIYLKSAARMWSRVLAFDPKNEFGKELGYTEIHERAELVDALEASTDGGQFVFVGYKKDDFQFFCACAFNFLRQAPAMVVVEELPAVTSSGKASDQWNRLINQQRVFGGLLAATAQRAQEIDKTILNQADYVHVAMQSTKDADYISDAFEVGSELIPDRKLRWVQLQRKHVIQKGKVDFTGERLPDGRKRPRFKKLPKGQVLKMDKFGRFSGLQYN